MKKITIVLVATILILFLSGCGQLQNPIPQEEIENFYVAYNHSSEKSYQSMEISGSGYMELTFLPIETLNSDKCNNPQSQQPCYDINVDLATTWAYPSQDEIINWINQIKDSGFMDYNMVDSSYIIEGGRYYPYTITIKLDGKEKTLIYKSYPGAELKPNQFKIVEDMLLSIIHKHCSSIDTIC